MDSIVGGAKPSVQSISDQLTIANVKAEANLNMSKIITAGAACALLSWYNGDNSENMIKKIGLVGVAQGVASSAVDMGRNAGYLRDEPDCPLNRALEISGTSGLYWVVHKKGFKFPNVRNQGLKEAVGSSAVATLFSKDLENLVKKNYN